MQDTAPLTPEAYLAICQALYREAALLDAGRFDEWLAFLTEDIVYQAPVRVTRERGKPDVSDEMLHFDDTYISLKNRIARINSGFAWAEDPPSRTRHFVSNVQVFPTERADEVGVHSSLLLYRNRGAEATHDLLSGERQDRLRWVDGAWRLARRRVILDQATLGTKNLGIFL
jgi:ethylbenzene dioxygenase beta subunit